MKRVGDTITKHFLFFFFSILTWPESDFVPFLCCLKNVLNKLNCQLKFSSALHYRKTFCK